MACEAGFDAIASLLIAQGVPIRARNIAGQTARSLADRAACEQTVALNAYKQVELRQLALKEDFSPAYLVIDEKSLSGSRLSTGTPEGELVAASTLDFEIPDYIGAAIVKIDVEDAELRVLQGAKLYLKRNLPLVIFEYNEISKAHFSLDQVVELLGTGYQIFRLREDRNLGSLKNRAWNCVAVHHESVFWNTCQSLIYD